MGKTIDIECQNCKYSKKGFFFGRRRIASGDYFPFFDSNNKEVMFLDISNCIDVNITKLKISLNKKEINKFIHGGQVPYFLKRMYKKKFFGTKKISSEPIYLQSKNNFCPKCEKFEMKFIDKGEIFESIKI